MITKALLLNSFFVLLSSLSIIGLFFALAKNDDSVVTFFISDWATIMSFLLLLFWLRPKYLRTDALAK